MPGQNTSGVPRTKDIVLGRGDIYVASLSTVGKPGAWRHMGHANAFSVTVDTETAEYTSNLGGSGINQTVKSAVTGRASSIGFTLNSIEDDNQALFLAGEVASYTNPTVAGFTNSALTTSLELGRWYDLETDATPGVRAYDVESGNLTVNRDPGGTPVTLVEGVAGVGDYTLDGPGGRIFFHETPTTGSLVAGDTIEVVLAADAGAQASVVQVKGQTVTSVSVAVKFIQEDAATGNRYEHEFKSVKLTADGEQSMMTGTDWQEMPLTGSVEQNTYFTTGEQYYTGRELPSA